MNVRNAVKPSDIIKVFKHMKDITLERNPMNVKNVIKHLVVSVIFENMKEPT